MLYFEKKCGENVENTVDASLISEGHEVSAKITHQKGKVIGIVACAVLAIALFLGWLFGTDYVQMVKDSTLTNYDYGKSLGESLDDWFSGDVTWDSYEEYDTVYVTASCVCPYIGGMYDSHQVFTFIIVDDEHFRFIGAYGSDGYEIFSTSTNGWLVDTYVNLYSVFGVDLHESALRAAFGDEESLDIFKGL